MLKFAFYRAPGTLRDRAIRLTSWSRYSHVEFVLDGPLPRGHAVCVSASKRDGNKVRSKVFHMDPTHWDFIEVPGDYTAARRFALSQVGQPYNTIGAVLSVTPFEAQVGKGWWCSQFMAAIAQAGGIDTPPPHTLHPGEFYDVLEAQEGMGRTKAVVQTTTIGTGGR